MNPFDDLRSQDFTEQHLSKPQNTRVNQSSLGFEDSSSHQPPSSDSPSKRLPYRRSCAIAWSNRGQLLVATFQQQSFGKELKREQADDSYPQPSISEDYFKRGGLKGNRLSGMDSRRQQENTTNMDDYADFTAKDHKSYSNFYRDEGISGAAGGAFQNYPLQVVSQTNWMASAYGRSIFNQKNAAPERPQKKRRDGHSNFQSQSDLPSRKSPKHGKETSKQKEEKPTLQNKAIVSVLSFDDLVPNLDSCDSLDLLSLSKSSLRNQMQRLGVDSSSKEIWKLASVVMGNLQKNTIFSDSYHNSLQTQMTFWRYKINIWKDHVLGLRYILRCLFHFQKEGDFVQFCLLGAILLEYESKIHRFVEHLANHPPEQDTPPEHPLPIMRETQERKKNNKNFLQFNPAQKGPNRSQFDHLYTGAKASRLESFAQAGVALPNKSRQDFFLLQTAQDKFVTMNEAMFLNYSSTKRSVLNTNSVARLDHSRQNQNFKSFNNGRPQPESEALANEIDVHSTKSIKSLSHPNQGSDREKRNLIFNVSDEEDEEDIIIVEHPANQTRVEHASSEFSGLIPDTNVRRSLRYREEYRDNEKPREKQREKPHRSPDHLAQHIPSFFAKDQGTPSHSAIRSAFQTQQPLREELLSTAKRAEGDKESEGHPKVLTSDLEVEVTQPEKQEHEASLMLKDYPEESRVLLVHLRKFADLLMAWGKQEKAIQIEKLVAKCYQLQESLHREKKENSVFSQGLLFGQSSLNQEQEANAFITNLPECQDCSSKPIECQICNLTVRGLAHQCFHCGHGGHLKHIQEYVASQHENTGGSMEFISLGIKCPCGWCDCRLCFQ